MQWLHLTRHKTGDRRALRKLVVARAAAECIIHSVSNMNNKYKTNDHKLSPREYLRWCLCLKLLVILTISRQLAIAYILWRDYMYITFMINVNLIKAYHSVEGLYVHYLHD